MNKTTRSIPNIAKQDQQHSIHWCMYYMNSILEEIEVCNDLNFQ